MKYTFKAQKKITIDCNDAGISFLQTGGEDEQNDFIHFEWNRIPELIETLEVMKYQWTEASIS